MPTPEPNVHIQLIDDPLRSIGTRGDHISATLPLKLLLYLSCLEAPGASRRVPDPGMALHHAKRL
jgi:hypothetical protein